MKLKKFCVLLILGIYLSSCSMFNNSSIEEDQTTEENSDIPVDDEIANEKANVKLDKEKSENQSNDDSFQDNSLNNPDEENKSNKDKKNNLSIIEQQDKDILKQYEDINNNATFKVNTAFNYYGNNVAIIKLDHYSEARIKNKEMLLQKQETDSNEKIKMSPEFMEAEKYLNFDVKTSDESYKLLNLSSEHTKLLDTLIASAKKNDASIVFIYLNGTKISQWNDSSLKIEKTIYSQYITNYIYKNVKNVVIEKKYMEGIPSDEIFILIYKYEGGIPTNYFNAKKIKSAEWLLKYRELEDKRLEEESKRAEEIEKTLKQSASLDLNDSASSNKSKKSKSSRSITQPK